MNKVDLKKLTSIDEDFALWAAEQGALLRARKFDRADLDNVADEIEDLGRSIKFEIDSRMEVLLQHLLKWQFQPSKRSNSWRSTIVEQRVRIARLIEESPSVKRYPAVNLKGGFVLGRDRAITETRLPESSFPEECPYSLEEILSMDFWPGGKELPVPSKRR